MRKEIFKLIVAEFEKLGINPTQWLGTRTNVKRINKKNMADSSINEFAIKNEFDLQGKDRLLKLFSEEAKYLGQLNDSQAATLLQNLKVANKVINPPPKPEAGIYQFSKLPGKKLTPGEYTAQSAADQAKIESAILKAGMEVSSVDRTLAKRLNLDMSKVSDWEKLQAWKDKHGVPDWAKDTEGGIGSLFKVVEDNPIADIGTQLDLIKKEGKSLVDQAKRLTDMAWEMSPEGQAFREMSRKDIIRREREGKGFAGGLFGPRNDGFFRAVVRPFLLAQHDKGKIKLAENTYNSLKNSDDLKAMGDFQSADPVRVFRQHYGDDAFDLIPDEQAFGGGQYGPTSQERIDVLEKVIKEPILKEGPANPGGYLTKGEYQAKIDHQDEVLGYMNRDEGRFGNMKPDELAEEIMATEKTKKNLIKTMNELYPSTGTTDLPPKKVWSKEEIKAQADATLDKKLEGTGVTREGFVDPFEMIHGDSKKGKEIAKKLGITAKPGFPVTEAGKADLKVVSKLPSKEPLNIRLMKNFDQPLTNEGLAKEGYNLSEIGVLQRARNRMTTGDEAHPNEALLREKELLADEAGVEVDELDVAIDWGDMTPEPMAAGGGVGSMFRRV
jgi:hypothetical protein